MKKIKGLLIICLLLSASSYAQYSLTNAGTLHISSVTDTFYINGTFTNSATASLVNNGNVFLRGNIANSQAADLTGTGTIFVTGTADQSLSSTGAFKNLTVNKLSGNIILSTNVSFSTLLHFISGKITTGTNSVIIKSTSALTGSSQVTGWVNGNIDKPVATGAVTRIFETGDATVYAPVTITFPAITTAGTITAKTTAGDHPNLGTSIIIPNKSVNRNYTLTNNGAVFNTYSAVFNFAGTDVDATANTSTFQVGMYTGSWFMLGTSNRNATNTRVAGFSQLGSFAIGETFIVVPVKFISADAEKQGNVNKISWTVSNEININNYVVERSNSATGPFTAISSSVIKNTNNYAALDMQPLSSINFYRVKAVEHGGGSFYSKVIHVRDLHSGPAITVFPNPVKGAMVSLGLRNIPEDNYAVKVYNAMGQMVMTTMLNHTDVNGNYTLSVGSIPSGRYEIKLSGKAGNFRTTLIKE